MSKMSVYIKTFKLKDGDKDKKNKLMPFRIDDEKLLEKYKAIWNKIEDLKNIDLNDLPVYDDRYIKIKIKTCNDKVYTNVHGLNLLEDYIKCESFIVIYIDLLLEYGSNYYLQIYLDNCAYEIAKKQMKDYLDDNFFKA